MTRLFVQLLLSVVVGASVGLSLKADSKTEVRQTLLEAGVLLRETATGTVQAIGEMAARVNATFSAQADAGASPETIAETEIKAGSDVNLNAENGFSIHDALPNISLNHTFANKSQAAVEADPLGQDIEITEKSKSLLNLDLEAGE